LIAARSGDRDKSGVSFISFRNLDRAGEELDRLVGEMREWSMPRVIGFKNKCSRNY
jgi:hypothetical protein